MEPLDQDLDESEVELPTEPMLLNVGPAHPAMHGTVRIVMELSGESIESCDVQVGYLHRGFEKMCEQGTWTQCIPYTDRLNYASPLVNNFIFCEAVERLLGITVPERCAYIRVILSELSRITDHLTCLGMSAAELGAMAADARRRDLEMRHQPAVRVHFLRRERQHAPLRVVFGQPLQVGQEEARVGRHLLDVAVRRHDQEHDRVLGQRGRMEPQRGRRHARQARRGPAEPGADGSGFQQRPKSKRRRSGEQG